MTAPEELQALRRHLDAIDAVTAAMAEANGLITDRPLDIAYFQRFDLIERTASRALLKSFEQLQDLVAKIIRLILTLEDEDLTGLSARALADRAESIGLIGSADRMSAVTRLRNRLVHEYPLTAEQQFARFSDVWDAQSSLLAMTASITDYLHAREYQGLTDD